MCITLTNIGFMHYRKGDFCKALTMYQEVLQMYSKALKFEENADIIRNMQIELVLTQMGLILLKFNELEPALKYLKKSLRIRQKYSNPNTSDVAVSLYNVALIYQKLHRYGKALKYFRKALRIEREMHGFDYQDVPTTLTSIGEVLTILGRKDIALESFEKALLIIERKSIEDNSILVAKLLNYIGNIYLQRGDTNVSMSMFVKASRIYREADLSDANIAVFNWEVDINNYVASAAAA